MSDLSVNTGKWLEVDRGNIHGRQSRLCIFACHDADHFLRLIQYTNRHLRAGRDGLTLFSVLAYVDRILILNTRVGLQLKPKVFSENVDLSNKLNAT